MADTRGIRAGRAFVELGVSDKLTRGLRRAQARLRAFGAAVQQIGQRLVAVSASVGVAVGLGLRVFATFEQRMARTKALTGAAGKNFDDLSQRAQQLGATTVFSASQAAEAMGFFAQAGFKVNEILKAIGPTLNLAAAGQLEIAQAADIAAKIMAGMGLAADDLGRAVDVLTKAMTTANTDLAQLGDAMKFVGPIAKSAGIEFEEVVAAVQLLSNAGIQGEMAGTTLRAALLSLTSPSEQARKELQRLGVSVTDAEGNVRPLADIIEDLNTSLAGMGSGAQLDILGRIFPARAAAGVAELISQGAPKLRQFTSVLRESGGTAARIADVLLNTLTGDTIILRSALENLGIKIGEVFGPPLRLVVKEITKVIGSIAEWVKENRELVLIVGASAAAVGVAGVALISLGVAAQVAAFAFGGIASILSGVAGAFGLVVSAIGAIFTPLGAVIAIVAALGVATLHVSGAFGRAARFIGQAFGELRTVVRETLGGITNALKSGDIALAGKIAMLGLKLVWLQGKESLLSIWFGLRDRVVQAWITLRTKILVATSKLAESLALAWVGLKSTVVDVVSALGNAIVRLWLNVKTRVQKVWIDLQAFFGRISDEQAAKAKASLDAELDRFEKKVAEAKRKRDRFDAETARAITEQAARERREFRAKAEEQRLRLQAQRENTLRKIERQIVEVAGDLHDAVAEAAKKAQEGADAQAEATNKQKELAQLTAAAVNGARQAVDLAGLFQRQTLGTFNAAILNRIGGLGAGLIFERIARATEETARNTREISTPEFK